MGVIALDLGELTLRLEVENDLGRGLASAKREVETLPPTVQREMVKVRRVMDDEGRQSGGTLARGINQGLIRNSPLIVAGVSAALAAGAPLMTAAVGTLFGGVGAVAAAQTVEVRSAWSELGRDIRDGAVADAAVLVPVFVEMTDRLGASFRKLRPEIRDAFADSAPLIRTFEDGVISLAENAMPGLARSIANAGSVLDGLEHFLSETGTGLTDFLDALTAHSPAAGSAFASLGDIMGSLLPILGEVLGQGAELAADVLPMVSGSLGVVLKVTQALGPALPIVAQGFLALKIAQAVTGWVGGLGAALDGLAARTGATSLAGGRLSSTLTGVGKAAPLVGIAIGLLGAAWAKGEQEMDDYSRGLDTLFATTVQGGQASHEAAAALETLRAKVADVGDGFGTFGSELPDRLRDAQAAFDHTQASMSAVDRAQQDVTKATNDYQFAVGELGPNSAAAENASTKLKGAQAALAAEQDRLALATHGVTAAMIEQANQALASIDSGFAYRNSVDQLEDAQATLADTIRNRTNADKDLRTSAEDVQRAQLAVEEQTYRTALAYGQQQADLSGLSKDSAEYARIVQEQTLAKLYELQKAAGPQMAAAIGTQIAALQAAGVSLTGTATSASATADRMRDLGLAVVQVPGNKTVFIDAPTADQKRRLEELGFVTRTLPDGRIYVTADTSPAAGTLAAFINQRRTLTIQANVVRGTTYQGVGGMPTAATGGQVVPGGIRRDVGGPVDGPGGPTDDLVAAMGPGGIRYRLSNGEHILTAREVQAAGGHGAIRELRRALLQPGGGAGMAGSRSTSISVVAHTADERRIADAITRGQRDADFLAGVG